MFTGLITKTAKVTDCARNEDGSLSLTLDDPFGESETVFVGESIAVNGCCLTALAESESADSLRFFVSGESASLTTLAQLSAGATVNLERALKLGERMGGHVVSGHVDTRGSLIGLEDEAGSKRMRFSYPRRFAYLVLPKGSITVDGVSLTVNELEDDAEVCSFAVNIIPHTLKETNLATLRVGDAVNLEFDMVAKLFQRAVSLGESGGISVSASQATVNDL